MSEEKKKYSKYDATVLQHQALKEWQASKMFCCNAPQGFKLAVKRAIRECEEFAPGLKKKKK